MKSLDLRNQLNAVKTSRERKGSDTVVVQSGKLRYIGKGFLVEVPTSLPDLAISTNDAARVYDWAFSFWQTDPNISIEVRKNVVVFSALLYNGRVNSVFSVELQSTNDYDDIDEVVLTPLLTNPYRFNITEDLWRIAQDNVNLARDEYSKSSAPGTTTVDISNSILTISAKHARQTKFTYQVNGNYSLPDKWDATFLTDSFTFAPGKFSKPINSGATLYYDQPQFDMYKISFQNNESKVLSPFMVEYPNGIRVVLSPLWH